MLEVSLVTPHPVTRAIVESFKSTFVGSAQGAVEPPAYVPLKWFRRGRLDGRSVLPVEPGPLSAHGVPISPYP